MRTKLIATILISVSFVFATNAFSEVDYEPTNGWHEDVDGEMGPKEFRIVNEDGNLTRAHCPYTCEDRGVDRQNCKEWKSENGQEYYVQDTRQRQLAVPLDEPSPTESSGR